MKVSAYVCGLVAMLAIAGQGETYTWARMSSDGKNFEGGAWETLSYWTVGEGATPETYPGEGDTIVLPSDLGTGIDCQMKALTLTTSVNERSAGTVIGGRNYEIVLSVPRSSGQNQYRMVKIENPNGFAGAWRTSQPRTLMYFANDSSFTPRLAVLETQSRPYVNVTNAGATVKIGLLKAKNDSSSYSSNGGTRYTAGGAISKIGDGILEIEEGGGIEERVYLDAGSLVLDGKAKPTASLESILSRAWLRLDATRRDTMKTYEGDDGRLYVTNWADVNGSARSAHLDVQSNIPTWSDDFVTAPKAPFISPVKSGTDRDLMDFGSESATYEETLGPRHCYLRFDTCSQVRELFIVRWRTDPYNMYSSIIGHSTQYPLHCNGNYSLFSTAAAASVLRGEVRINGITSFYGSQPVDSYSDGLDTMHLLNVAPTNAISLNLLGSERYFAARSGGCRIGEVLIFTEKLSDGERAQVNEYLMKKWFKGYVPCEVGAVSMRTGTSIEVPEGRIARVRRISLYGDTLVKTGGGTLVVDSISPTNAKLDIRGGDIKINPADDDVVTDDAPAASPFVWLDATQAATLVCSNSEDGTTAYLTNWTDRAGGAVSATIPWGHAYFVNHFPTIKAGVPSAGLSVVDFGNTSSSATGTGSWMWLTQRGEVAYEGFMVYRHTVNVWGNIFGSSTVDFMRNNNANANPSTYISPGYSISGVAVSQWRRDGAVEDPFRGRTTFPINGAFSLVSFSAPVKVRSDCLAKDRTANVSAASGLGGMQIGEMILYNRKLTDAERRNTEAYLMKKWLGKNHPEAAGEGTKPASYAYAEGLDRVIDTDDDVSVPSVTGGNLAYVKRGDGAATLVQTCATTNDTYTPLSFTVEGGALNVSYNYPQDPIYRMDATVDSFAGIYEEDGKTFFSRWNDADGRGVYATTPNLSNCTNPTLVTATMAPGVERRVANFGDSTATQGGLAFNKAFYNVREAVTVHADNNGNQNLFCFSGNYHFLRGWNPYGALLQNYDFRVSAAVNGYIAVDGVERPYNYVLPSGYHLVNMAPTNSTYIDRIAIDRSTTIGRCLIGEQIAFSNALTTTRRALMTASMMKKWFDVGDGALQTNNVADIALGGGTLSLGYSDTIVPGSMFAAQSISGSGAVVVPGSVSSPLVAAAGDGLMVGGDLVLPDGAAIMVSFDENGEPVCTAVSGSVTAEGAVNVSFAAPVGRAAIGRYPVIAADSLSGTSPAEWTTGALSRRNVRLSAESGVVYLDVFPNGMQIIVN